MWYKAIRQEENQVVFFPPHCSSSEERRRHLDNKNKQVFLCFPTICTTFAIDNKPKFT